MEITCIITDDEPMARLGLEKYVSRVESLRLVGSCDNAADLGAMIAETRPDLLFLDIEMPHISGVDFLTSLQHRPPYVILTTAYERYAIKGFDLNVTDYLLKPISFSRFLTSVNRVMDLESRRMEQSGNDHIFVKCDRSLRRICISGIMRVEALENYLRIYTSDGHSVVTRSTMQHISSVLPSGTFVQIHRSHIVNYRMIERVEGNSVLVGGVYLSVSQPYRERLFAMIGDNSL